MRLELYNSATIKAPGRLFDPSRPWTRETLRVRYGLFEHPQLGVTLVDSGYGPRCFGRTAKRTFGLWLYTLIFRAELLPQGQVSQVLADKGLKPEDVQTIIVSHLHADHISELRSFTQARFVGSRDAFEAVGRSGWRGPLLHGSFLELLPDDYASRLDAIEDLPTIDLPHGLGAGRALIDGVLSVVPLEGHAVGHFGLYSARGECALRRGCALGASSPAFGSAARGATSAHCKRCQRRRSRPSPTAWVRASGRDGCSVP